MLQALGHTVNVFPESNASFLVLWLFFLSKSSSSELLIKELCGLLVVVCGTGGNICSFGFVRAIQSSHVARRMFQCFIHELKILIAFIMYSFPDLISHFWPTTKRDTMLFSTAFN